MSAMFAPSLLCVWSAAEIKSDGPFNICDQFKSYYLYGLNESYNSTYLSELQDVSAEKIRSIAVKYLNFDDMLQVIAGKL